MMEANFGDKVYVKPLLEAEMLLTYFNNDEGWLNNVYSPYYNKDNVVIILEN